MLYKYNAKDIEFALREESPPPPFPIAADRAAWEAVHHKLGEVMVQSILADAEKAATSPIPVLPASLYLDCVRTGNRPRYEKPMDERRTRLTTLVLAECLEYKGRFLDPIMDYAWAICEESSWVYPAHQYNRSVLPEVDYPYIDLGAAMTGHMLAEVDHLLGETLEPSLGKRIRHECETRLFTPYLTRHDFWWLYNTQEREVNNWTAVCNAGVAGAALYLEDDTAQLAQMIHKAARSLDDYLDTFDADGGSTEGPGYWGYGFGNYVMLAHLVEQRTNRRVNFLDSKLIRDIAQFPLRTPLSHGYYVNFSDCDPTVSFPPSLLGFLAQRLDLPDLLKLEMDQNHHHSQQLVWAIRDLFWTVEPSAEDHIPDAHNWFGEMHWMIARANPADPDGLILAAKGGHNEEMHNQNDVGNIIVHVKGESVIPDIGRGTYTRQYFAEERYTFLVNQSFGHSVPVPNGQQQGAGRMFSADVLAHTTTDAADVLKLEMKAAYPAEADLESLVRTVTLHREAQAWVEVIDEAIFASVPGQLESVLTTFGTVETGNGTVTLTGDKAALTVAFDAAAVSVSVDTVENVDIATGARDVQRVIFALKEKQPSAAIRLAIRPT